MLPRWLLVSDVDNTLLGDDAGLREFVSLYHTSSAFFLALNSSRPCAHVRASLARLETAVEPKAIIGAMGTEIEVDDCPLDDWTRRFNGWDRTPIDAVMTKLGFRLHPPELQTPFKASFEVPKSEQARATEAIEATGVQALIVRSGESDFDVLPPKAGKGAATVHLTRTLGVPRDRLIVAGDSTNDLAMFRAAEKGIVVRNASTALKSAVNPSNVYFAESDYALGLIEGLRYWNVPIDRT